MAGQLKTLKRVVPDGGWGWVVAAASCVLQFLYNGTCFTFGIIFVDLIRYFEASQAVTSWIGSIQMALLNLTGILAVPFIHRFGWRATAITGSILCAVGFGTSALATNIYILYLTYGVMTGTGCGFIQLVSIVCVQQYFDKQRAVANGIAIAGAGAGITVFGASASYIIASLGWQTMMWINGGILLVFGVLSGAMYKPLPYETVEEEKPRRHKVKKHPKMNAIKETDETDLGGGESTELLMTVSIYEDTPFTHHSFSGSFEVVEAVPVRHSIPILSIVPSLITDDDLFDYEITEFPTAVECQLPVKTRRRYQVASHFYQFIAIMKSLIDFRLFKSPVYCLFTFNMLMFQFAVLIPFTYLPELATVYGTPYSQASLLIPVIGFTSIFSRLISGWLADKFPKKRFDAVGTIFTLIGVLELLTPCFINYPSLVIYSCIFGVLDGTIFTLYSVILFDLMDRSVFDKGLSLVLATMSIACVTAAPMSGLIIDEIGNVAEIRLPFMIVGGFQIMGALAYFIIPFIHKHPIGEKVLQGSKPATDDETAPLLQAEEKSHAYSDSSVADSQESTQPGGNKRHKSASDAFIFM